MRDSVAIGGTFFEFSIFDRLFAKVIESQKAWAKRVIYWHNDVTVDQRAAYAHYFGKGPLAKV